MIKCLAIWSRWPVPLNGTQARAVSGVSADSQLFEIVIKVRRQREREGGCG